MTFSALRNTMFGAVVAVVAAAGAMVAGGSTPAFAAPCASLPCVWVDAVSGGGIDSNANVGQTFDVDIYALNFTPNTIGTLRFVLTYDATRLHVTSGPSTSGLSTSLFDCTVVNGDLAEIHPFADGNPDTGEAYLYCDGTAAASPGQNGPIARVEFASYSPGSSPLTLSHVQIGNTAGMEIMSCAPVNFAAEGGCHDAAVNFDGPPLPTPPPAPCTVSYAIEGNLLQCADGSKVRMIGVGSPVGVERGAEWARTVTNWFLGGRTVGLETDTTLTDGVARLAYPHWTDSSGADYNMSALLIYVGMARHTPDGANVAHSDWFNGAQGWARSACWNMWDHGNPWAGESGC